MAKLDPVRDIRFEYRCKSDKHIYADIMGFMLQEDAPLASDAVLAGIRKFLERCDRLRERAAQEPV